VLLAIAVREFILNPALHKLPWSARGLRRLAVYAAGFLVLAAVRRTSTWIAGVALVFGIAAAGPAPFAVLALFAAAALSLGSWFCDDPAIAFLLGEGLLGVAASLLGRTYLCYPITFLCLLLVPISGCAATGCAALRAAWPMLCAPRADRPSSPSSPSCSAFPFCSH